MFHEAPPGTVCKCKVIVQADTTDDSERSESTPHSVAPGVWEDRRLKQVTHVKHINKGMQHFMEKMLSKVLDSAF